MSAWPPVFLLTHPRLPWSLDATEMGLNIASLDALPWERAFQEMADVEAGEEVNTDEGRQVGHYWLRDPTLAPTMGQAKAIGDTLEAVRTFAEQVRSGEIASEDGLPFTDVVHIGIGGSALGPALVVEALPSPGLSVHFINNTDPDGIALVLGQLEEAGRHAVFVVVSKSGGTPETRNGMLLVQSWLRSRGLQVASHFVAITGEGSVLDQQAIEEKWLARFHIWDWVGGRTSVMAAVGMLPAELAGIPTAPLLEGAREMDVWTRSTDWRTNPAALLAAAWYEAGNGVGDKAMVVLPYCDRLLLLSRYLQQLVMESIGKRLDRDGNEVRQGLTVYGNKGSTDQHAFVQQLRDGRHDFFVLFLQVLEDGAGSSEILDGEANAGDFLQGFLLGTRRALASEGRASLTFTVPHVTAETLGGLIALFERAVGLYAGLIGINAYHQPGVEAGKRAARDVLSLARALRRAVADAPRTIPELATELDADPVELFHLCERMVSTKRLSRTASGYGAP